MTGKVTSKGQVTLPVSIRRRLGIEAGTKLEFVVREDGLLEVGVISGSLKDLKGMLPKPCKMLTIDEMGAFSGPGE